MSEQDLDLITELISGRLPPGERDAALRRITSDPVLQSEYEAQLATASLLHDLPAPTMTADERTSLHASLRQQLNLVEAIPPATTPAPSRWQRWWAPVTALAAAAAVVVGAVIILPGSGSDDSFDVASDAVTETTLASLNAGDPLGGGADSDGALTDEEAAPTAAASQAEPTTTAAASEETTTTAAASAEDVVGEAQPDALPHVPEGDLDQMALAYAADPEAFARGFDPLARGSSSTDTAGVDTCLAEASSAAGASVVVPVATTVVDGAEAFVFSVMPPAAEPYLVALDLSTCRELASTRP